MKSLYRLFIDVLVIYLSLCFTYLFLSRIGFLSPIFIQIPFDLKTFCAGGGDILAYTAQLGRLDFISMVLALIATLLAILGFAGFWTIKREALYTAEHAAKTEVKVITPSIIQDWLDEKGSAMIKEIFLNNYPEFHSKVQEIERMMATVLDEDANKIASAMGDKVCD
jgi:hypothetical protein